MTCAASGVPGRTCEIAPPTDLLERGPDLLGAVRVPGGALLDDPLDHAAHERDPGGLEHLQVDRREEVRGRAVAGQRRPQQVREGP